MAFSAELTRLDSLPQRDVLESCANLDELEAVTEQYAQVAELLKAFPSSTECDESAHIRQRIKLELLEAQSALLKLHQSAHQLARLEAECTSMAKFIADHRLRELVDDMLLDLAYSVSRKTTPARHSPHMKLDGDREEPIEAIQTADVKESTRIPQGFEAGSTEQTESCASYQPRSVTSEELASVPSYLRGRVTADKVNETYDLLRDVTEQRYNLLLKKKNRKALTNEEQAAVARMRSEIIPAVKMERFITEADVKLFKGIKLAKAAITHISILRSLQRLREVREKNILRIILNS